MQCVVCIVRQYIVKSRLSAYKVKPQDSFINFKNLCIINRAQSVGTFWDSGDFLINDLMSLSYSQL